MNIVRNLMLTFALTAAPVAALLATAGASSAFPNSSVNGEGCPNKGGVVCQIQLSANGQSGAGMMKPAKVTSEAVDGEMNRAGFAGG